MPLEHAREDEVPQRPVRIPRRLDQPQHVRDLVLAVVRRPAARVVVQRDVEVLAGRPQRLVHRVVQRRDLGVVGTAGEQDAAAQAGLLDEAHVLHGLVDVVEEDLPDAGAPVGSHRAPVGEPPVVGADAGEAALEVPSRRRPGDQRGRREERRHRVREDDLADDAVGLELGDAPLVVPVPRAAFAL